MQIPLLMLPGLNNSGPQHWQAIWQERQGSSIRLEPTSWKDPELSDWMLAMDRAVEACPAPPILVAHSMGCLLSVFWANTHPARLSISGAYLVAPPNFKRNGFPAPSFARVPELPIPYPTLVVASTNDPYCSIDVARR